VDVIVTAGTPASLAAKKATSTIPIVMGSITDPVGSGLVASLARPGGNVTGLANLLADVGQKHLEMLLTMVPRLSRVAVMLNRANAAHALVLKNIEAAAQNLKLKIFVVPARAPSEIEKGFELMAREQAGAVMVLQDRVFTQQRAQLAVLAAQYNLPSIFFVSRIRRGRRSDELRPEQTRAIPASGRVRAQDIPGCETRGAARRAPDHCRALHQCKNRAGAGACDSRGASGARDEDHRIVARNVGTPRQNGLFAGAGGPPPC